MNLELLHSIEKSILENNLDDYRFVFDLGDCIFEVRPVDDGYDYQTFDYEGTEIYLIDGVYDDPDIPPLTAIRNILAGEGRCFEDASLIYYGRNRIKEN